MNLEPQKFFIDLMDFFSIILPGALLTSLFMNDAGPAILGNRYWLLAGIDGWAAFLFASYLIGHLIFLLGSWLDEFYDWARNYTLNAQIERLARRGRMLHWLPRFLIWLVFKRERNLAVQRAGQIKEVALSSVQAKDTINAFQWCKAFLNAENRDALATVQRFEANSKFFRSLAVVLIILLATWPLQHQWPSGGILLVVLLLLLAVWRFMEQRSKATTQAYWSVITLSARSGKIQLGKPPGAESNAGRAGGVVFRKRHGRGEFLLVEAKKDPSQWVLPKGQVEESEHPRETAVREVHEETGQWGRIIDDLGDVSYTLNGRVVTVRFYLMQFMGRGLPVDRDRRHLWLPLKEAVAKASHKETRELIQATERVVSVL